MTVFVVCSAAAAAGLAVAFEIGRVAEKRLSGTCKDALPFQGFDWKSEDAKSAAYVFIGLFVTEVVFLPSFLNPLWYLTNEGNSFGSSFLAFLVFGSWSGLLCLGYGGIAGSFQALNNERVAFESEKETHEITRTQAEAQLQEQRNKLAKDQRINLASAAAVAGEWKKFHIAREEDLKAGVMRAESEQIWSRTITEEFDQKVMHVVDNATDKRWREIEDQDLTLEAIRYRNKEKERKIKEQRARRAERANSEKETLRNETSNLLKLTDELESLKETMEKLKQENQRKEQEKLQELKEREKALQNKEKVLEKTHHEQLEKLRNKEEKLKSREEQFESGEEQKKLKELSEKLESSKLHVAKFNEEVMMKERKKDEEFRKRELALKRREQELSKMAPGAKGMSDYLKLFEQEGPEDETVTTEEKSIGIRLLTVRSIKQELSREQMEASSNDLPTVQEDEEKKEEEIEKPKPFSLMDLDEEEEEGSVVVDKCGSDKSLLDLDDEEEEENDNSTCMLNANEKVDNNKDSDNDSLSHQIQQDIAAMEREDSWNVECSSTNTIGETPYVPAVSSPLQERNDNATFKDTLTITENTSDPEYVVLNKAAHENGTSPRAGKKIHRGFDSSTNKTKKGKKSMVMSEDAAVEVIAWNDPGPY